MTTASAPGPSLTMPLRHADGPDPHFSGDRLARAMDAERKRTKESKTALVLRLATAASTSTVTIYSWKKGAGKPDFDQGLALARELRVDPLDLTE